MEEEAGIEKEKCYGNSSLNLAPAPSPALNELMDFQLN